MKCNDCRHYESSDCLRCIHKPNREDRFEAKEKQIIPQKAGELWESPSGFYYHTEMQASGLILVGASGGAVCQIIPVLSTTAETWTRLHPPV